MNAEKDMLKKTLDPTFKYVWQMFFRLVNMSDKFKLIHVGGDEATLRMSLLVQITLATYAVLRQVGILEVTDINIEWRGFHNASSIKTEDLDDIWRLWQVSETFLANHPIINAKVNTYIHSLTNKSK